MATLNAADCEVAFDNRTRQLYATDASPYQIVPSAVAFPKNAKHAAQIIQASLFFGLPVTPRGAGTGLSGGAIGDGLIDIVHRFARELRPAVLDDLGLVPALHSFMKNFTERTGVRTHLKAFKGVEEMEMARRTVLFRVAQEALTNVARHAKASRADVSLEKLPDGICLKIKDDGKSFQVERTLHANVGKRLGLLGMRERLEMVGGKFSVESAPGQGTTVIAQIPSGKIVARKKMPIRFRVAKI